MPSEYHWLDAFTGKAERRSNGDLHRYVTLDRSLFVRGPSPWADVRAFGAAGDGVQDDTAAIQAAIDFVADFGGGIVFLPAGTYIVSRQVQVKRLVTLRGAGNCTTIQASSSFPTSTALVRIGTGAAEVLHDTRLESIRLHCNHITGSIGVYSDEANERSGLFDCVITAYMQYGVHFEGNNARNFLLEQLEIGASASASGSTGIFFDQTGNVCTVRRATIVVASGGAQQAAGIKASFTQICADHVHVENHADGILFDTGSNGHVLNVVGHGNVDNTVRINTQGAVALVNVYKLGGTNAIQDDTSSKTITDNVVAFYGVHHGTTAPKQVITTSQSVSTVPMARVTRSVAATISDSVETTVGWDQEDYDTDAMHDNVTNNGRLTAKRAGVYRVWAHVRWAANSTGQRVIALRKNGTTQLAEDRRTAISVSGQSISTTVELAVNDYIEVRVTQTSGGNLNLDQTQSAFGMELVGY